MRGLALGDRLVAGQVLELAIASLPVTVPTALAVFPADLAPESRE